MAQYLLNILPFDSIEEARWGIAGTLNEDVKIKNDSNFNTTERSFCNDVMQILNDIRKV